MKKQFLPPILVIIFSGTSLMRIESASDIKSVLFITILVMGAGLGLLLKAVFDYIKQKK